MIPSFLLKSLVEKDDDTGRALFWNAEIGWTVFELADRFTYGETRRLNLPVGSDWVLEDDELKGGAA